MKKLSRSERKKLIAVYKNSLSSITVNNYNKENIKYHINQAEKHFPQNKMTAVFSDLEERAGKFVYWKYDYISRDYVNLYITIEKGILKYAVQIYNQENVRKLSNVLMWFKITKDKLPKEPDEALILLLHYRMQRRQKALADIKEDIKILENENVKLKLELLKSEKDRKSLLANYRKTEEYLEYYAEQSRFHDGVLWTKNFNFMKCTTNDCLEEGYIKNGERTYIITAENGNSAVLYYKKNLCTGHITTILSGKLANGKSLTMNTAVNCSYNDIILILHKMFINNIVYISLQSESDLEAVTDKASNMRLTLK